MGSTRSRLTSVVCGLFLIGPAAKVACHEENEQQSCSRSSPLPTNLPLGAAAMRYPEAREESTSIVRELLHPFSLQEFADKYWENKPLVIRGRSPKHYQHLVEFGLVDVESVIENGVALAGAGKEPMVLGSDWNIIKRVFVHADGEFWTAGLPPLASSPSSSSGGSRSGTRPEEENARGTRGQGGGEKRVVPLAEAHQAFHRGGFSLVINRLQRRWRGVWGVSHALEDVLGQPVNANLYMTPPESQGFEAHFDWMDGIVVQLVGTKTWILYDEMLPSPRADLKYKPAAADLGEPIAVLELRPGDLMYIPRGWPHEAAVNGTAGGSSARGPSLHVTFGVETAVSGTYESLLHHALEVAAVHHPVLFGLPPDKDKEEGETKSENDNGGNAGAHEQAELPWLQLVHLWVHVVASRDSRLRRAVPLAPIFYPPAPPPTAATGDGGDDRHHGEKNAREEGVCTQLGAHRQQQEAAAAAAAAASSKVLPDFQLALDACAGTEDAASRTMALLASLLRGGTLRRVRDMFAIHGSGPHDDGGGTGVGGGAPAPEAEAAAELEREEAALSRPLHELEQEWARPAFEAFDQASFSPFLLRKKIEDFQRVASPEMALQRMVLAATRRAKARAAMTEQDLARCGQG